MANLHLTYECRDCGHRWADVWPCEVEAPCPGCGETYTPAQTAPTTAPANMSCEPLPAPAKGEPA